MGIKEEIAFVEREFISAPLLLEALTLQEDVLLYQAASWFLRNIESLDKLRMFSFNSERRDFFRCDPPWSSNAFAAISAEFDFGVSWEEDGDDFIGGWLSSELKEFFSRTSLKYPELFIESILNNEKSLTTVVKISNDVSDPSSKLMEFDSELEVSTKERGTLLTIIAAIAGEAKLSLVTPSKTAELIADMTQKMGTPVSKRAIEGHLKKIPDALERRTR